MELSKRQIRELVLSKGMSRDNFQSAFYSDREEYMVHVFTEKRDDKNHVRITVMDRNTGQTVAQINEVGKIENLKPLDYFVASEMGHVRLYKYRNDNPAGA